MTVAEAIRELRGELSQQRFSNRFDLTVSAIQNYEGSGRAARIPASYELTQFLMYAEDARKPSAANALRLALREKLGVPEGRKLTL